VSPSLMVGTAGLPGRVAGILWAAVAALPAQTPPPAPPASAPPATAAPQETAPPAPPDLSPAEQTRLARKIDAALEQAWKDAGLKPAAPCDDATFLRRLSLDVRGVIPAREEVAEFLASHAADKREKKIDEVLDDPAFARELSYLWSRALLTSAANGGEARELRPYLHGRFAEHAPFADVVRSLVGAEGRRKEDPEASFVLAYGGQPEALAGITARALLGVQIQCAQCHAHPYDTWKQTDFQGFQSFFANVGKAAAMDTMVDPRRERAAALALLQQGLKATEEKEAAEAATGDGSTGGDPKADPPNPEPKKRRPRRRGRLSGDLAKVDDPFTLETSDPDLYQRCVSGMPAKTKEKFDALVRRHKNGAGPRFLDGKPYRETPELPRRAALAAWIVDPENPWFARATVNRIWGHLFGHGLIDPVDDLTGSSDVVAAPLLHELGEEFESHATDLRFLVGTLVRTRAFALANAATSDADARAKQERNFAAHPMRPLEAEQMLHSLERATGRGDKADDAANPERERARDRMLAKFRYYFDDDEGGASDSFEGSLPEALFMMKGDRTNQLRLELKDVLAEIKDKDARIEALFLATLSREPTESERGKLAPMVSHGPAKDGFGDLLWALLNSAEFKFER
jgi:hypothetical protein